MERLFSRRISGRCGLLLYLTVEMTRYTVYYDRSHIALDERAYIIDKFIGYVSSILGYPFAGNKFFIVCNLVDVLYFRTALIRIVGESL